MRKAVSRDRPAAHASSLWEVTKHLHVAAIVVAAGKSERMGQNKLLMKLRRKFLIEHVLDALAESAVDEIVVVTGHNPEKISRILEKRKDHLRIVENEDYEEGMISSFKKGLSTVEHSDAAFLILGDQLIMDPVFLKIMVQEMEKNPLMLIVSPIYEEKRGHPVLFSHKLYKQILSLKKHETLRDITRSCSKSTLLLKGDRWTTFDIDEPGDISIALELLRKKSQHKIQNEKARGKMGKPAPQIPGN